MGPVKKDYVLVELCADKKTKRMFYYIGKILAEKDEDNDYEVSFLRSCKKHVRKFTMLQITDISSCKRGNDRSSIANTNAIRPAQTSDGLLILRSVILKH